MMNKLSDSYDQIYLRDKLSFYDLSTKFPINRNEALFQLAGSGQKILEIGCGTGNTLYNLRNSFKELHGLEISSIRASKINKLCAEKQLNINITVGNIEEGLDFPDEYFDVIIWADVIEHVVDLWSAMKEINRLLSMNGRLVTCTPNIAELRRRITLLSGRFPATSGTNEGLTVRSGELFDGGHLHYFTFSSLSKLYLKYGIKPDKRLGFGSLGKFHNIYPPLLSGAVCISGTKFREN